MRRTFCSASKLVVSLTFALASALLADVYDHSGRAGDFQDGKWLNKTTSPPGGPNVFGNPGAGDDAYFYAADITASGGSVRLLTGGNLNLSGMLNAVNVGILQSLSGAGTLNLQAIVTDPNGFGPLINIAGGHLKAQNGDGVATVSAGGTVVDGTCSGTNGCGFFDGGSSLTITGLGGPDGAAFANASTLTANGGLKDFRLQISSGSTAQVSTITNSLATVAGTGSRLTVAGDFSLNPQSLNISNGGAVTVNGNLTQVAGGPLFVTDTGSTLTVGQDLLHNTSSGTDIRIYRGGAVRVQGNLREIRGQVQLDGSGSALTVFKDFSVMAGFVDLSAGATLTVNGDLSLDGGTDRATGRPIGGGGHWQGANTTISTSQAIFVGDKTGSFSLAIDKGVTMRTGSALIGSNAGSNGTVNLSDAGTLWEVQAGGLGVGQDGNGTFSISLGARLLFGSGTVFGVGLNSGSNGSMTVDGAGSSIDASGALFGIGAEAGSRGSLVLKNGARMTIGKDSNIGESGQGSLSVFSGSQVTVSGTTTKFIVGNKAGSSGSMSVGQAGSSLTVAGPATVVNQASARGSVNISNGGNWTINGSFTVGSGGAGTVMIAGKDATCRVTGTVPGNAHKIGTAGGTGSVAISAGGVLGVAGNGLILGDDVGGNGSISATGADSLLLVSTEVGLIVGQNGIGSVTLSNGAIAQVRPFGVTVAERSGSQGSISVSDPGSFFGTPDILFGEVPIPGFQVKGGAGTITVQNSGQMRVDKSLDIANSTANPSVIIDNGQIAVGSGAFGPAGSLRVSEGGFLQGNSRAVRGQVIVGIGGRISPGNSPGIFAIDGTYEQDDGGTYSAEIGGPDPGTGHDQISVTGSAILGGNLNVRLTNGFTPVVGQTFRILSAASVSGAFTSISEPSNAGINLTSDATGVTVTITSVVAGAPVISSATTAHPAPGAPFSYQITATNNPTSFGATNLPAGLTVDNSTGLIFGTPASAGAFIVPINANNAAGSGQADLILIVEPTSGIAPILGGKLLNISTRLRVQTGDNALIGGFIVTGTDAKKVIIRAIGPSLTQSGVGGALVDPVLELHGSDGSLIVANDNWKDTQEAEITATGIAPKNDLESAIVRTLAPGSYTAILRGKNDGTGIGLVEAYDLDQAANSTLANISTRGFVETNDNVLIGGFIVGGGSGGFARVVVRAIGPSLGTSGVQGALQDPTLELRDQNGALITANDNWKETQLAEITALGLAPKNDAESALVASLPPGNATAIVRGKGGTTGVGLVEVYNVP